MLQEKKAAACSANKQFWVERKPFFERGQKKYPTTCQYSSTPQPQNWAAVCFFYSLVPEIKKNYIGHQQLHALPKIKVCLQVHQKIHRNLPNSKLSINSKKTPQNLHFYTFSCLPNKLVQLSIRSKSQMQSTTTQMQSTIVVWMIIYALSQTLCGQETAA